jgi:superfamily I DNA and/or RNA helicase
MQRKPKQVLRIATVDNFQGEEAKVVIISLVRSNIMKSVGFLKTINRINVLLSRAKHGMYLIGNADTYAYIPMWSKVLGMLKEVDAIGPAFSLCCPRHQDTDMLVS